MASSVRAEDAGFAPARNARRPRRAPRLGARRLLFFGRLRRAWRRQWPIALTVVVLVLAAGALAALTSDAGLVETAAFFIPGAVFGGFSAATLRELSRNSITSLSSLGKYREYAVLGAAPLLSKRTLRELPPDQRTPLGALTFQHASPFATAFRDLQGALGAEQIIAVISAAPGEGASTVALSAAISAKQQGKRVILLDCDLRRRTFSAALEHEPQAGLVEACVEPEHWRDFVDEEDETGLHFIPAARPPTNWQALAGMPGLPVLLENLRAEFDLIVLDCPPALTSADGPVVARMADKSVVVVAWDETPVAALRDTIRALRARSRGSAGIFVNRVPEGYRFGRLR